jgi:hypothetical protein
MFAVTATSKALALAGIDHIVTEGGRIIVEADYDGDRMVPDVISVTKDGNRYIAKRSKKKMVTFRAYQKKLMKYRREAGYGVVEKKNREKLGKKAGKVRPAQKKSAKLAWTKSPILKKKHETHVKKVDAKRKAAEDRALQILSKKKAAAPAKKASKPAAKPAAKKASKPAVKVNSKKPAGKIKIGGKKRFA